MEIAQHGTFQLDIRYHFSYVAKMSVLLKYPVAWRLIL